LESAVKVGGTAGTVISRKQIYIIRQTEEPEQAVNMHLSGTGGFFIGSFKNAPIESGMN